MESAVPFGGTNLMIIIFPYSTITPTTFTGKVFISTPEDTGPAHTQRLIRSCRVKIFGPKPGDFYCLWEILQGYAEARCDAR